MLQLLGNIYEYNKIEIWSYLQKKGSLFLYITSCT